jgi:hypothetical protein
VFNVSLTVLKAAYPDRPTFRIIEVPRETAKVDDTTRPHGRRATDREPMAARIASAGAGPEPQSSTG